MSEHVSAQRKNTEQNNNAAPTSAQFQPRPFSPVAELPVQRTTEELQTKHSGEQNPGYDLSREYAEGNSLFSLAPIQRQPETTANTPDISNAPLLTGISGIQAKLTVGAVGDKYEQEADAVAARVVEQINSLQVQRQEGEEEELQMRPLLMENIRTTGKPGKVELQKQPIVPTVQNIERSLPVIQRREIEGIEIEAQVNKSKILNLTREKFKKFHDALRNLVSHEQVEYRSLTMRWFEACQDISDAQDETIEKTIVERWLDNNTYKPKDEGWDKNIDEYKKKDINLWAEEKYKRAHRIEKAELTQNNLVQKLILAMLKSTSYRAVRQEHVDSFSKNGMLISSDVKEEERNNGAEAAFTAGLFHSRARSCKLKFGR